jgi:hypothetical protein
MTNYERHVRRELLRWESRLLKPPGFLEKASKPIQTKVNELIPDKVQQAMTAAIRSMVKGVVAGIEFMPKGSPQLGLSLSERDQQAEKLIDTYRKVAAVEGAGTGAGGFMLGLVDFPALIAIKMKFLFELAHVYGYSTQLIHERLFLLHVFQLAFSSQALKPTLYRTVKHWEDTSIPWRFKANSLDLIDWEQFQKEYRDAIDLRKMLQMVPGIGAVVGAWANYGLLGELGEAGQNSFRLRILTSEA